MTDKPSAEISEKFVVYDFDPNNLPVEYLAAIGLVISCASQTEHIVRDFIGARLGIDNAETIALGAHMSMPMKNDIVRSLVELNAPHASEVDEVDDILDRIQEAMSRRNAVAHNDFAIHPDTGEIFSMREKARGSLQVELKPIPLNELQEIAGEVYQAGMALQNYMMTRRMGPRFREGPIREPLNRKKAERVKRREQLGDRY